MTVLEIESRTGPARRLLDWARQRRRHPAQPDPLKLLDQLNDHLLRDIRYGREPRRGLRSQDSATLWLGRHAPER